MTKAHSQKNSATGGVTESAASARSQVAASAHAPSALGDTSVGVLLGLNAWLACALWPTLVGSRSGKGGIAWTVLPLVVLILGAASLRRRHPAQAWLLVLAFPLTLGAALSFGSAASLEQLGGSMWVAVAASSLLAFGAAALTRTRPDTACIDAVVRPLSDDPWDGPTTHAPRLARWVSALLTAGAASFIVVAATWGGTETLERRWGEAAAEGGLLTAVVATALAVASLATFLGGALRATPRPQELAHDRPLRVASLMLLALLGATTYAVLR